MKVGFIGLGAMGLPMAKNVIRGGYDLYTMVHENKTPYNELSEMGVKFLSQPKEIASISDVVITILPADKQLIEVVVGENGLLAGMKSGQVLIDMTTAKSNTLINLSEKLNKIGVSVIDAPVSGGTQGAISGNLTIMLGGKDFLIEKMRPLLETMGKQMYKCGDVGSGKVVKMVNQQLAAIHLLAIGESFALGKKAGVDSKIMFEVIRESSGYSKMMDLRLPDFILEQSFEPGFKLDLMKKDINLAVDSALEMNIPLVLGSMASQIFSAASNAGYGNEDFSRAADFLAKLSNQD